MLSSSASTSSAPVARSEANRIGARALAARWTRLLRSLYLGRGPARARCEGGDQGGHAAAASPRRRSHALRQRVIYGKPPPPDEELMLELRRRFQGEVEALSEYLGRDLVAQWGYDRLD